MNKKEFLNSSESMRQLVLDIVQIISSYGEDGASISSIISDITKSGKSENLSSEDLKKLIKTELPKSLGKISIGERRLTKYVIDDLDVACQLVNEFYDKGMTKYDSWRLRLDVFNYILKNPGITTNKVCEEFSIDPSFLDSFNSDLIGYGTSGIDFYKDTNSGTKMRIKDDDKSKITGVINCALDESKPKVKESHHKPKEDDTKLVKLNDDQKKNIQYRIVSIIYRKNWISESEISKIYYREYKENLKYPVIKSMMRNVPGVIMKGDEYHCEISEALSVVFPSKVAVSIEFVTNKEINISNWNNIRLSRIFNGIYIYKIEGKNNYDLIPEVLELITLGASFDKKISDRVLEIVKNSLKSGDKYIL